MIKKDKKIEFEIGEEESPETPFYYQGEGYKRKIWLNEEGYRFLSSLDDKERKKTDEESRCLVYNENGLLIRCRKKCSGCPVYQKYGRIGGGLSMDALQEGNSHIDFVSSDDVATGYAKKEIFDALGKALSEIDELDQRIFSLCFEEERSEREASSILGISQPAIHKRIAKLKTCLREKLKDFFPR